MLGHRWVVGGGWSGVGGRGVGGRGGCALTQTPNPNQVDFCPRFQHYGKCEYGKECRFAHDESERRPRVLPISYKTAILYATRFLRTAPAPTVRNATSHTCRSVKNELYENPVVLLKG